MSVYAHDRLEGEFDPPDYAASQNAYAFPSVDAPYNDEFGWAPRLNQSPVGVPDATRTGRWPRQIYPPDHGREDILGRSHRSTLHNGGVPVSEIKYDPAYPDPAKGFFRWAVSARATPPPEPRWTQRLMPRTYFFWRPFETNLPKEGARTFSGVHFSMADHRRNYDTLGMAPAKTRRNTYRLEPTPWDTNLVDVPDVHTSAIPIPVVEGNRSWRLT